MVRSVPILASALIFMGAALPDTGPVPAQKPMQSDTGAPATMPAAPSRPDPKPEHGPDRTATHSEMPSDVPVPEKKPEQPSAETGEAPTPEPKPDVSAAPEPAPAKPTPPPIVKEDPDDLAACLADLKAIGAKFEKLAKIDGEEDGCGIESPIRLEEPLLDVKLSDPATIRCETALTLAHWLKDTAAPVLAVAKPGRRIVKVDTAPGYTCRLRNNANTGKVSEHARGNAIDIGGLIFDDGEKLIMTPKVEDSTMDGALQRTITAGACLHFSTVLSPGSDASHQDHLHLDVLDRKQGFRYCR